MEKMSSFLLFFSCFYPKQHISPSPLSGSILQNIHPWIPQKNVLKKQGNSYGAYSQGHDESSQGNNSNAQWAGSKYHYSSAKQWDEFKFW